MAALVAEHVRLAASEWTCLSCTYNNANSDAACAVCDVPKLDLPSLHPPLASVVVAISAEEWACPSCTYTNATTDVACGMCTTPNPTPAEPRGVGGVAAVIGAADAGQEGGGVGGGGGEDEFDDLPFLPPPKLQSMASVVLVSVTADQLPPFRKKKVCRFRGWQMVTAASGEHSTGVSRCV